MDEQTTPKQDRLAEIKQRAERATPPGSVNREHAAFVCRVRVDVGWLIAEVERLRAALAAKAGAE